jgi:hypothetical protein
MTGTTFTILTTRDASHMQALPRRVPLHTATSTHAQRTRHRTRRLMTRLLARACGAALGALIVMALANAVG